MNKKELAVELSKVSTFEKAKVKLEQYPTDSEIAADFLWKAYLYGDIEGNKIVDFGAGHGVLAAGALFLGAKSVSLIDIDGNALDIARSNIKQMGKRANKKFNVRFYNRNINAVNLKADVVIQNPPFGVKESHSDKIFLVKAMETAPVIYTFHKMSTKHFVEAVSRDHGFKAVLLERYKFPLKKSMWFHMKKVHHVDVGVWRISKKEKGL